MILVDSSVWISFFKGKEETQPLFGLINSNNICTNNVILSEIVPSLLLRNEKHLVDTLNSLENLEIAINWTEIIEIQKANLENGINRVGLPDLIIAQNSIQNNASLYTFDKHFQLMTKHLDLDLFD